MSSGWFSDSDALETDADQLERQARTRLFGPSTISGIMHSAMLRPPWVYRSGVTALGSLEREAGPGEQHMVERPLRPLPSDLVRDAEVADLEQDAVLGVLAFQRGFQTDRHGTSRHRCR